MTVSVFFKKTAMVKLTFLDRTMPAQQHSNSLPLKSKLVARNPKELWRGNWGFILNNYLIKIIIKLRNLSN